MNSAASNQQIAHFANLGQVSEITMGQSPESVSLNTNEAGLPFLQGCAEFGRKSPLTTVYCNPPLRVSNPESILISVRAPVGTLNWGDQRYCIGRGLAAIKAIGNLADSEFLFYVIAQNANFLHRRSQGSTFLAISGNDIKIFPVPAFDIESQKKIARILQTIDQAIEKTEALIEKYQQIKAGLMHDLFTRGIDTNGQLRPPRDQAPELYQQTPIGWVPKEWKFGTCEDICEHIIDCKNRTPPVKPEGFPVIRTPNVRNGQFVDEGLVFTDYRSYLIWTARGKPVSGDIVITREAPVGEVCKIPDRHSQSCLGQRMMLYRTDTTKIDNDYFLYALQSTAVQNRLDLISGGSTVGHVRVGDIKSLWIMYPESRLEQSRIAKALNSISDRQNKEEVQLDKLAKQKSGLMHDLLTGKVPVKLERETQPEADYGESYSHV